MDNSNNYKADGLHIPMAQDLLCMYHTIAKDELLQELKKDSKSLDSVQNYIDIGCLTHCRGYDFACEYYVNPETMGRMQ